MNKCQHCHKAIALEKLPDRCPHCDAGTICSGSLCMYCRTLQKWVNACKKTRAAGEGSDLSVLTQVNAYTREAYCPECDERTTQLLHGYDADGTLWMGHACDCGSFQCVVCDLLIEQSKACCR